MSTKSILCAAAILCTATASASITADDPRSENLDLLGRTVTYATSLLRSYANVQLHESTIDFSNNYHWTNAPKPFTLANLADFNYDTTCAFRAGDALEIFFEPELLEGEISIYYSGIYGHEAVVEVGDGGGHYLFPEVTKEGYIVGPAGTACLMFTFTTDVVLEEISINKVGYFVTPTDAALSYEEVGYLWDVIRTAGKTLEKGTASLEEITNVLDTLLCAMEPLQDLANYYAQLAEVPEEPAPMTITEPDDTPQQARLQSVSLQEAQAAKFDLFGRALTGSARGLYIQGGKVRF